MSGWQRVLITGAAGRIGSVLREGLRGAYPGVRRTLSTVRSLVVQRATGSKRAEGKCEAYVVRNVLKAIYRPPLDNDVADIAAQRNLPGVVDRVLSRHPRNDQVVVIDPFALAQ